MRAARRALGALPLAVRVAVPGSGRSAGAAVHVLLLGVAAAVPVAAQPPHGRHDGEMCVAIGADRASCGPAQIDWHPGLLRVRIDDIVYRLHFQGSAVEVVLMHGPMQVDDFSVPFAWAGGVLRFEDAPRAARYEIRFPPPSVGVARP